MRKGLLGIGLVVLAATSPLFCAASVGATAPPVAPLPRTPSILPPGSPGPLPAVVTVARPGRLTVWMMTVSARPITIKGARDGAHEMVQEINGFDYAFKDVRAYDVKRQAISPELLPRLLGQECQVVVAQEGCLIDAQHLRWLKEGILLLVVPERPLAGWAASLNDEPANGPADPR